ncbi:hypothetical protein F7R14_22390 [Pseudomonas lini]|uniref:Uncharacterized protein n=1 Tax=Pseudomonas lini TaxID=163011 RepID=A0A7V7P1B9_9PSED|nr:hypothetical protein F7R14_22390 [Pseudomonas lini]
MRGCTIVPTLCVGMPQRTPRVRLERDAERPGLHSHAERGNDQNRRVRVSTRRGGSGLVRSGGRLLQCQAIR